MKEYNALLGEKIDLDKAKELLKLALDKEQLHLAEVLKSSIEIAEKNGIEIFEIVTPFIEQVNESFLHAIEQLPEYIDSNEITGLNASVTPDDIYQYITDLILKRIEKADSLPWHKMWQDVPNEANFKTYLNFDSKKPYRGINFMLLNLDPFGNLIYRENPYFLTFNQIKKHGGKLKKGSKATRIVYFIQLYEFTHRNKEGEKVLEFGTYNHKKYIKWLEKNKVKIESLTGKKIEEFKNRYIPILKYYNVFAGEDVEDIDFGDFPKSATSSRSDEEKIEAAEAIVANYPKPPKIVFQGNQPAYYPMRDRILMTPLNQFKNPQYFYSVFFHELTHSTGHSSRLDRGNDTRKRDGSAEDKKAYSFEELVAEMGAVFLCAESGIFFETRDNSAKYLDHYIKQLKENIKKDNRFFFRAASAAQAAADHMLDRDKEGVPAYLQEVKKEKKNYKVGDSFYSDSSKKEFTITKIDKDGSVHIDSNPPSGNFRNQDIIQGSEFNRFIKEGVFTSVKTEVNKTQKSKKKENIENEPALNAPWHDGIAKEALTACGRLKPGFRYEKGGKIVKVKQKKKEDKPVKRIATATRTKKGWYAIQMKDGKSWNGSTTDTFAEYKAKSDAVKSIKSQGLIYEETKGKGYKRKTKPTPSVGKTDTSNRRFNMKDIKLDEKRFQNRSKLNEEVVSNIVNNFKATDLDPLVIWLDPKDKKYYLLAGHHRHEALKRLKRKTAPVRIANSDYPTEKDAIRYARELSNANRTLEQAHERAVIYRKKIKEGITKAALEKEAAIEGRNRSFVLNLAHLSERGKALQAVIQFAESASIQDKNEVDKIADWIGQARRNNSELTNAHENEMFDFLRDSNVSKRVTNKAQFLQLITSTTSDMFYDYTKPLNLKRFKYQTEGEKQYDQEVAELRDHIATKQKSITDIQDRFSNPNNRKYINADSKDYSSIKKTADKRVAAINEEIRSLQRTLQDLYRNKGRYTNAGSNQAALFGAKPKKRTKLNGVANILADSDVESEFFTIPGAVGEFLQQVEKKPVHSVVITLDGAQGAGKTTMMYRFINSFATANKPCVFFSLEEHPQSHLAREKAQEYIDQENIPFVDSVGELDSKEQFYKIVDQYDFIFIDSWQKLMREIGNIRLDEDLRKRFDGKVFVIIFQQTTTGRTKGGAEIVFDGDIIIKMVKEARFADNYAYMDKNRYTLRPIDELRYNIAGDYTYSMVNETPKENEKIAFNFLIE